MFNFIRKQIPNAGAKSVTPMQINPTCEELYKQSLADLKKFTNEELPVLKQNYEEAMKVLEQNAKTMKALMKLK